MDILTTKYNNMVKINFRQIPIYQGIAKQERVACDISESLANAIYSTVPGIAAHVLAEKIYKNGEVEMNPEEMAIVRKVTEVLPGQYTDSINDHLDEKEGQQ